MADYGGFGAIVKEAQAIADAERDRPAIDCPKCGALLKVNREGAKNCPMGH